MLRVAHALFGLGLALVLARALAQSWLADEIVDPWAVSALRVGLP